MNSRNHMEMHKSNHANSLDEKIHKVKCKYRQNDKKCETCAIKYEQCDCFLH